MKTFLFILILSLKISLKAQTICSASVISKEKTYLPLFASYDNEAHFITSKNVSVKKHTINFHLFKKENKTVKRRLTLDPYFFRHRFVGRLTGLSLRLKF